MIVAAASVSKSVPQGPSASSPVHGSLHQGEHGHVDRLMARKCRVDRVLFLPLYRLVSRLRGKRADETRGGAYLAITLT